MRTPCNAVLYVDDDESNRVVFEAAFGDQFELVMCDSADQAIRIMEEREVALVLTDQRMPGRTGNDLLAEVRRRFPKIVRMLLTGHADIKAILASVNQNLVTRYFIKPWDREEITRALHWGVEAYAIACTQDGELLQARLLETERLTTLGAVQASFLHELGQPLAHLSSCASELEDFAAIVPGLLDLLRKGNPAGDGLEDAERLLGDFPEVLDDLQSAAVLLTSLRDDVQDLLLRSPHRASQHCEAEDVTRAIRLAIVMNKAEASDLGVDIQHRGTTPPALAFQAEHLTQVLINLIRNAIQCLADTRGPREVTVETTVSEKHLHIRICDTGPGMNAEQLARVGRQFYSTREKGTGLGVFTSRSLLEQGGGGLELVSVPEQGTQAVITIPRA